MLAVCVFGQCRVSQKVHRGCCRAFSRRVHSCLLWMQLVALLTKEAFFSTCAWIQCYLPSSRGALTLLTE